MIPFSSPAVLFQVYHADSHLYALSMHHWDTACGAGHTVMQHSKHKLSDTQSNDDHGYSWTSCNFLREEVIVLQEQQSSYISPSAQCLAAAVSNIKQLENRIQAVCKLWSCEVLSYSSLLQESSVFAMHWLLALFESHFLTLLWHTKQGYKWPFSTTYLKVPWLYSHCCLLLTLIKVY